MKPNAVSLPFHLKQTLSGLTAAYFAGIKRILPGHHSPIQPLHRKATHHLPRALNADEYCANKLAAAHCYAIGKDDARYFYNPLCNGAPKNSI